LIQALTPSLRVPPVKDYHGFDPGKYPALAGSQQAGAAKPVETEKQATMIATASITLTGFILGLL
jgi:hypothetical protein